jgi:hypothetical protein
MRTFDAKPKTTPPLRSFQPVAPMRARFREGTEALPVRTDLLQPQARRDFSGIPVGPGGARGIPGNATAQAYPTSHLAEAESRVRIHADDAAAASADNLGAHAYAKGRDIFLRTGAYQPETPRGQRLLMHEMAHVAQQQRRDQSAASSDALEREADQAAMDGLAGRPVRVHLSAPDSHPQLQKANWKPGSDVFVNPTAEVQIKTKGGLFSGNDQAHVTVSTQHRLTYDVDHTTSEDPFRWSHLKDVVDNGHVRIAAVSAQHRFKVREKQGAPLVERSIDELRIIEQNLSTMGVTLKAGGLSPDPVYDLIYYDESVGVGALSHELLGHEWLALKGAPSVHPPKGSAEEKAKGTIGTGHHITDPFGAIFSGTVQAYIDRYIESVATKVTVKTSMGEVASVPKSPTQGIGADVLVKALNDLHTHAATGLTKTHYTGPVAQAWRIICNNFDLLQTQSEAIKAGNENLTFTKEIILMVSLLLFRSWTPAQQGGFRNLLADFTGTKGGFKVNELSTKLEELVGAAPSPFKPSTGFPTP